MTCDLSVTLERSDARYRGGEPIRGVVRLVAEQDLNPRALTLALRWRTLGFGNQDHGESAKLDLAGPQQLAAGARLELPFELPAPTRPISYAGAQFSVQHAVVATLDLPWAKDTSAEAIYSLDPGLPPDELTDRSKQLGQLKAPAVEISSWLAVPGILLLLVLAIMLIVMLVSTAFVWIPVVALIALWIWASKRAVGARLGDIEVDLPPPTIAPGEPFAVALRCVPRKSFTITGITLQLTAKEKATKGSGKHRTTRERELFKHRQELRRAGPVVAGERLDLRAAITFPDTAAFTLQMPNHAVDWRAELRIDIPWFPDWAQTLQLQVVPREWTQALDQQTPRPSVRAATPPAAPPAPSAAAIAPPASLFALLDELQRADSNRRTALVEAASEHRFELTLRVERSSATPAGRELPAAYADGKSLLGKLDGSEHAVEVALPFQDEELILPRRGETWSGHVLPTGWDNLYKRLRVRSV